MAARPTRQDWLFLLVLGVMWGTSYVWIKVGVQTLSTFTLIAARLGIGLALLAAVAAARRLELPRNPRIYGHLLVMAVINIVIPFTLITTAEQQVNSNIAAIINGSVPLFVVVIAAWFLHDEPLTLNRLVGIAVGYVGVVVLVAPGLLSGQASGSIMGEVALVGSTLAYAFGGVYARANMRGVQPLVPALFQVLFAFVIITGITLATEHPFQEAWPPETLFAVAWLGIFGSGLAYILNFRLLSRIGAGGAAVLAYLLPIVGIISGFFVRGEPVDLTLAIGTGLILGGIGLTTSKRGQRTIFGRAAAQAATTATAPGAPPPPR
ncbi:MAG TPA: DMT family transporter [Candidatus Limnocylindrales bacterium]|nr:DMT family transporter [Candidatus Limnocylindrales bacterium]